MRLKNCERSKTTLQVAVAILVLFIAFPVATQHSAHVHGEASGTLSLDNSNLRLELELPGYNLVGFEHPPRNPDQTEALQRATDLLDSGQWVQIDPGADCRPRELDTQVNGFDDPAHDSEHSHDHSIAAEHASFHMLVEWNCQRPDRLNWMDLRLFNDFSNQRSLTVDVLTDRIATRVRLRPDAVRIELAAP